MGSCLAGYNTCTCTCSCRCCIVCFYKTDDCQHGTPIQRCMNADASLELLAITAPTPGRCGHIEMIGNLAQFMNKYKKHETDTRCSFNVNFVSPLYTEEGTCWFTFVRSMLSVAFCESVCPIYFCSVLSIVQVVKHETECGPA